MTDILPNLSGIGADRCVKDRDKSVVEFLVDLEAKIIGETSLFINMNNESDNYDCTYFKIYNYMRSVVKDVIFDEFDLRDVVHQLSNAELSGLDSLIRGFYTGCLLDMLNDRNKSQGKSTSFYINGYGVKFDYLFSHAKNIDELVVDNFIGDNICSNIGCYEGSVNRLVVLNSVGRYIAEDVGSFRGKAGSVVAINNKCQGIIDFIGREGKCDIAIVKDNQGTAAYHTDDFGKIGVAAVVGCKGFELLSGVGSFGGAGIVLAVNNTGRYECSSAGWHKQSTHAIILIENGVRKPSSFCEDYGALLEYRTMKDFFDDNPKSADIRWKRFLPHDHKQVVGTYGVKEIVRLIDSMDQNDYRQVIETTKKIEAIYRSIKHNFDTGVKDD